MCKGNYTGDVRGAVQCTCGWGAGLQLRVDSSRQDFMGQQLVVVVGDTELRKIGV